MTDARAPKRFALLVGVDLYLNDASRKLKDGKTLNLNNLAGCVNDVKAMESFLQKEYQLNNPSILTSSLPEAIDGNPSEPIEAPDCLPTFSNIKREFDAIYDQVNAGDFFLFHFSGHGAKLKRVKSSPAGRLEDPSLLTVDFCCGQPAVRGWQLNEWLKRFDEKKVQVIVILDSCHSGGAWRGVRVRSPNDWPSADNLLNLPVDELVAEGARVEPTSRGAKLETSWSINPEGFTLMAACTSDQRAAEITVMGQARGVFTYELLDYVKRTNLAVTYRMIRDQLTQRLKRSHQKPEVYGRDKLLFGSMEPFSATPLAVRIEGDMVVVPVGKMHGVHRLSEFIPFPPVPGSSFCIEEVNDFECSARASPETIQILQNHQYMVIPSRWSLGDETFEVLVDSALGLRFQQLLYQALQNRIASRVEVIERDEYCDDSDTLRLEEWGDEVKIFGPESLIGYSDPVRPLQLKSDNLEELATSAAIALAHLARFGQILNLQTRASLESPPFELSFKPVDREVETAPFPHDQKFEVTFENKSGDELYLTILLLGPAFHVQQFFPGEDFPKPVAPYLRCSLFTFPMCLPDHPWAKEILSRNTRRDIFRTLVTRGKQVSWKSLEMPDIWDAHQVGLRSGASGGRHGGPLEYNVGLWVQDTEIITDSV